ncbi:hypothetical protein [Alkalihalobacillus sp. AL-G]|uniref:hypothetical protein n=1 Tax=Alkalihalobacillus sp. AL-G TaxID=2926399 RepID=UPI00272B51D6|nr:hypothetical protein [Alkalihalobacillus sp. AL-G]WLD94416.1 hypothetical protein MOJ78_05880 [Alkalihalobacillus sp. AL-G]
MKKTLKWVGMIIVGLIVLGSIFSDSEEGSETASGDNTTEAPAEKDNGKEKKEAKKEEPKTFAIGEDVKVGEFTYTVNGIEEKTKITMPYMDGSTDDRGEILDH